jgi:hypothetical protein
MKRKNLLISIMFAMLFVVVGIYTSVNAQYAGKKVPGLVNMGEYQICQPYGGWCDVSAQQVPEESMEVK